MTHLCVAIFVSDMAKAKGDAALAGELGADMVEYRIDGMTDIGAIAVLTRGSPLPCIVTCRPTWEGGRCEFPDAWRFTSLKTAAGANASYIDVELAAYRRSAADLDTTGRLILSAHDFVGRPDRLYNLIAEMNALPANVVKIVWTARTIRDNLEAFEILRNKAKPTIALCMGEAGLISRVLAKKFGGFLTFVALDNDCGTAPGQITISEMKRLYRWDSIGEKTKVYGVVASPVKHSMSPAIHNAAFEAIGYDGVYLPLLVEAGYESFKAFMETFIQFEGLDLCGLSITIPHKQNALRYLQEKQGDIEPLAQSIGSVNTILMEHSVALQQDMGSETGTGGVSRPGNVMSKGGARVPRLRGFNTDYAAILDSITAAMGIGREQLRNGRVAVLGAGGTGRAAVAALAHYGADVTVYNRTQDRGEALAAEFDGRTGRVHCAAFDGLAQSDCSILINTTSVGMHPNVEQSPLDAASLTLRSDMVVFDAVYNPMRTKLLAQAQSAGAKTVGGVEMFVRQAAAQFEKWTGHAAPVSVMRQVIERRLAR
ncbi:MAG: type I 3-dehydroquinate dehydratase [Planctomycetota bacterium]|nr:type I 3-dehydroquinate dehydratase [Planctomycetota bacterium]